MVDHSDYTCQNLFWTSPLHRNQKGNILRFLSSMLSSWKIGVDSEGTTAMNGVNLLGFVGWSDLIFRVDVLI